MDKSLVISVIAVLLFSEFVSPGACESDTQDVVLFNEIFLESQNIPKNDTSLLSRENIMSNSSNTMVLNPPRCRCVEMSACSQSDQISREQIVNGGSDILGIVNLRIDIHQCQNTSEVCCNILIGEAVAPLVKGPLNVTSSAGDSPWMHTRCGQVKEGQHGDGGFPWIVSISVEDLSQSDRSHAGDSNYKFLCFGSLIHPSVVLTTANCVFKAANSADRNSMRVIEFTSKNGSRSESHTIREVVFHNELYRKRFQFDLALLILDKEVMLSSELDTVCIPSFGNDGTYFESMICALTIDGDESDSSTGSDLNKIEGFVLTRKQCEAKLRNTSLGQSFQLHESLLCVEVNPTTPANTNETCEIGNGAPLVCKHGPSGYFIQVGIASWNLNFCDDKAVPIVYVNLPYLASWIRGKIRENHFDSKYFTLVDDDLLMRIGLLKTK